MRKRKNIIIYGAAAILAVAVIAFVLIWNYYSAVTTETVYNHRAQTAIETKIFVLRDETLLKSPDRGILVPLLKNGEKLAKNDVYGIVCGSTDEAEVYMQKKALEAELKRYVNLGNTVNTNTLDISRNTKETDSTFLQILDAVSNRSFGSLKESLNTLEDKIIERQLAIEPDSINFEERTAPLNEKLAQLSASASHTDSLTSNFSGYFVNYTDGFENTLSYDGIKQLKVQDVEKLLSNEVEQIKTPGGSKLIRNHIWYVLTVLDSKTAAKLEQGGKYILSVGKKDNFRLPAMLTSLGEVEDGKRLAVFECNEMNLDFAGLRIEDAKIILDEFNCYRIRTSALRTLDENQGVYVLRSNVSVFRRVFVIETRGNYVLVKTREDFLKAEGKDGAFLNLYDEVIVKARRVKNKGMVQI